MSDDVTVGAYCRVSGPDQEIENQRRRIERFAKKRGWDDIRWYVDDGISGRSKDGREAYQELLQDARRGDLDVVTALRIDRLGRSVSDLVTDIEQMQDWNVEVAFVDQPIDTTGKFSDVVISIFSALASVESELLASRVRDAYARKKENGDVDDWGRPRADVSEDIVEAVAAGEMSQAEAARRTDVSRTTIRNRVDELQA